MTVAVVVSPEAEAQIREVDSWWRKNREAAPDLFAQELADATTTLETMPSAGHRTSHLEVKGLRRILLRATRYHVYYVASPETVLILAVWSAVRGAGPDLKRLLH